MVEGLIVRAQNEFTFTATPNKEPKIHCKEGFRALRTFVNNNDQKLPSMHNNEYISFLNFYFDFRIIM